MSIRRGAPVAGGAVLLGGWLLGSVPLLLAGLGLLVASLAALALARFVLGRIRLERLPTAPVVVEGEDVVVEVRAVGAWVVPGGVRLRDELGGRDAPEVGLGRRAPTRVVFHDVPRGVHRLGPGRIVVEDPLGLVRATRPGVVGATIRVRPRVVALSSPFTSGVGRRAGGDARRGPGRSGGTDPQGVREHRDGESLRSVHWATSARTGRLMVRETDDPGRDDLVVVLDLEAAGVVGPAGRSSLDEAVRVAAALVHAEARAGRAVALVVAGAEPARFSVRGSGVGWEEALDALAAAAPVSGASTASVLDGIDRMVGDTLVVLITTSPAARHLDVLLRRRRAAVVVVDAPTYAGAPRSATEPALLRLAAHGVAVVVIRDGDDLAAALARPAEAARA